jgi:hypothetical protein
MSSDDINSVFSNLSKESQYFLNIDLKMCAILLFIILFCLITASLTAMFVPRYSEYFSNDQFSSYKNIQYSDYASIPLTALDVSATENIPNNILFGKANRIITSHVDGKVYFTLDINANLYVLGGQVYDAPNQKKIEQNYIVQLVNPKNKKTLLLGTLVKHGDGLYKLTFKADINDIAKALPDVKDINELIDYNIVRIVYTAKDATTRESISDQIVIEGDLNKLP